MASALNLDLGNAPSRPARVAKVTIDFTSVSSYTAGGETDAIATALHASLGANNYYCIPAAAHNGSATRYFQVNAADGKVKAYTTASLETEVTAAVDLSGYTAIHMVLVGKG